MINTKSYNQVVWQMIQKKRSTWERKYSLLFRNVLNKQFKDLADKIDATNYGSISVMGWISEEPVRKLFIEMYRTVGSAFAKDEYRQLKSDAGERLVKINEDIEGTWDQYFKSWVNEKAGVMIVSITKASRDQALNIIRNIINETTTLGADMIAREIRKALLQQGIELNQWRALRIARTEIVTASNVGSQLGAAATGYPMEKYWIPTYDSRTRDTHMAVERQNPKDINEAFLVADIYPAEIPGDPDLPAEERINCRCSIAHKIKES